MRREIETGPIVATLGGLLLLASLFFDWYGEFSGWSAFEVLDLVLAGVALAALAGAASRLGAPRWVSDRMLPALGVAAALLVVSQMVQHPPLGIERGLDSGPWLALVGAGLVLAGGVLALAHVSFALHVRERAAGGAAAEPGEPATPEHGEAAPAPGSLWQTGTPAPAPAPPPHDAPPEPAGEPAPAPGTAGAEAGAEGDAGADGDAATEDPTQRLPDEDRQG